MQEWGTALLGDVCEILDSRRRPVTKSDRKPGPYPYYGATGIQDYVDGHLFDEPLVLLGEDGAKWGSGENSAFAIAGKTWVNNHAHILRPARSRVLDGWIVSYLNYADLMPFVTGVTVPKLNQGRLREIPVPLPPLPEQRRIVGILDEAFKGIATAKANVEKNLQNARALFESQLHSAFVLHAEGWAVLPFEDCIEHVTHTAKIQRKQFLGAGKFPVVSQEAQFVNGYWDNPVDVFRVSRPVVLFGDHTRVLKYIAFDFVLGADGTKILAPKPFLVPKFFFYHLRNAPLASLGYSRHYRLLRELRVSYPDQDEQKRIADRLDANSENIERLVRLYERKASELDALKTSLLHHAFSGKL